MARTNRALFQPVVVPLIVAVALAVVVSIDARAATPKTRRVSLSSTGAEGNGASFDKDVSSTGRFIAFTSEASNLVAGDGNDVWDVFVRDRRTGTTTRVSVNSRGAGGNERSQWPAISGDGRFVVYESDATNLVKGDSNGHRDIFVHDLARGITTLVSKASGGAQSNENSYEPVISADGRFVAFASYASNLVAGDTNLHADIFVRDLVTGVTRLVSKSTDGAQGNGHSRWPAISADGRFVAFVSDASTLVANDQNAGNDIFVRNRKKGKTTRVSIGAGGIEANGESRAPSISADGRYVAFASAAANLVGTEDTNGYTDVFVRDRGARSTSRVSMNSALTIQGNGDSAYPSISADGRFVVFESFASDLVGTEDTNGYADIFVRDRQAGTTTRVSVNSAGTIQGNEDSRWPAISDDGRFIAFESDASSLIVADVAGHMDVFVRGPLI